MTDREIMANHVDAKDAAERLAALAYDANEERHELAGAVKRIRTVLTDPLLDDRQKVDQALTVVGKTLKAWDTRRETDSR